MKKIFINILASSMLILLFASCEDYLETIDKNSKVEANFFANQSDCEQALYGCYSILQAQNYCNIHQVTEAMSDNCYGGQGTDGNDGWDEFEDRGNLNMFKYPWQKYNWGIHRCNFLLDNLAKAPIEEEDKIWLEAEAKFLRAYFYFDFIRLFGNVTLSVNSVESDMEQASPEKVYELIANDLLFACDNLPAKYSDEWFGRATKWAAKSMLARVYLYYTGYYNKSDLANVVTASDVRSHIDEVMNPDNGFSLLPDFRSLWPYSQLTYWTGEEENLYAGEKNSEILFSIKFTDKGTSESYLEGAFDNVNLATGNTWLIYMGPRGADMGAFHYGWGFIPVTPTLYEAYDENDMRKDAIVTFETGSIDSWSEYSSDQKDYTGLWQQKYMPLRDEEGVAIAGNSGSAWQYGQSQDFYVIRYADVLLMASELYLGVDNAKSQTFLNTVRKRALGEDAFVEVPVTKASIFEERRLELAFEGIRYFDLLRYDGQDDLSYAKTNIEATSGIEVINGGSKILKEITFRKETKGLVQIPNDQIRESKYLNQNSGWEQ